jgi:hypothetical protein
MLEFPRNLAAEGLEFIPERSSGLEGWLPPPAMIYLATTHQGDGSARVLYRSALPISAQARNFVRLKVVSR